MKKTALFIAVLLLLTACLPACQKPKNTFVFTATVENVYQNSILVSTDDDVGFDLASVGFSDEIELDFNLLPGQTVEITAYDEIRESYPVQITAVKIALKTGV